MKNIEIEYKVMVDKQGFEKLEEFLDNLYKYKTYIQTNYYYDTDKVVGTYTSKDRHSEAFKNEVTTFIKNNKDKLMQYTFTFKQDKNGFYYYVGFERTNG